MALDPLVSLAFAIRSNPGVYAVLIGSGVSTSAGIPTGWGIVVDLIRRVAAATDGSDPPDAAGWYEEQFGEAATYTSVLDRLGPSPAERQAIIRSYIEPTPEEREQNVKVPTEAHRAIASLVVDGYVRVILTTNFDRLIEQALDDAGADYDVVASTDSIRGMRPLVHSPALLVKVHGDFRDARIRNTAGELEKYDDDLERLLDRILDEHGLIVSGWSASWDRALGDVISRQPVRRYTTFWSANSDPSDEAQDLIRERQATLLSGYDADTLFSTVASKLRALEEFDRPHPLSAGLAVAELKRYIPNPVDRLRLHDLVMGEVQRVLDATSAEAFPVPQSGGTKEDWLDRVGRYESTSEVLISMLAVATAWAEAIDHDRLLADAVQAVANSGESAGGLTAYIDLQRYPGVLSLYAVGLAAVARDRWSTLYTVAMERFWRGVSGQPVPLLGALQPWSAVGGGGGADPQWLHDRDTKLKTPLSDHLHEILRSPLKRVISTDQTYDEMFDRWEYLLALFSYDAVGRTTSYVPTGWIGRYVWRHPYDGGIQPGEWVSAQLTEHGAEWGPLREGFFAGSLEDLTSAKDHFDNILGSSTMRW